MLQLCLNCIKNDNIFAICKPDYNLKPLKRFTKREIFNTLSRLIPRHCQAPQSLYLLSTSNKFLITNVFFFYYGSSVCIPYQYLSHIMAKKLINYPGFSKKLKRRDNGTVPDVQHSLFNFMGL